VPNGDYFEWEFDPLPWRGEGFLKAPFFTMEDGMVAATEAAGLGVEVDEEKLRQWQVAP
jgi:L-alanine-DL-glutamate epimerase-like enolase superfamily enzyme